MGLTNRKMNIAAAFGTFDHSKNTDYGAGTFDADTTPILLDVRREAARSAHGYVIPGAICVDDISELSHLAKTALNDRSEWVAYCVHGHERSLAARCGLEMMSLNARIIPGGMDAYESSGGPLLPIIEGYTARLGQSRIWLFPDNSEGLVAGWLARRFLDPQSHQHYVPEEYIRSTLEQMSGSGTVADAFFDENGPIMDLQSMIEVLELRRIPNLVDRCLLALRLEAVASILAALPAIEAQKVCDLFIDGASTLASAGAGQ